MICRTLRPKSAWSCGINMFWDTDQAITRTTRAGARLRSSCAHPKACPPSRSIQEPAITRLRTKTRRSSFAFLTLLGALLLGAISTFAQIPVQTAPPPPPPGQETNNNSQSGSRIKVDVNLVVLHTTVLDDRGNFVEGLTQENFRAFEDKVEQKLSIFKREDVPVSMGLVIDNSGSMRDKRPRVNEAALTLVQNSNPQDEAFVVSFNDDFYLDLDKDFSSSIPELKEALERIDARGSTALYDAIIGSLDHVKKGSRDKKVLLI